MAGLNMNVVHGFECIIQKRIGPIRQPSKSPTQRSGEMEFEEKPRVKVLAKFLEDFIREDDRDREIAPSLKRLPRSDNSWEGFVHWAEKIESMIVEVEQASASFTRKQVVEELEPYCQHDPNCKKWKTDFTYFRHFDPEEECTCGLDAKIREGG